MSRSAQAGLGALLMGRGAASTRYKESVSAGEGGLVAQAESQVYEQG